MADNIAITPGSGATVATDDVSGVQYQRVKLDIGGDGASVPVTGTMPAGLPVAVTGVTGDVSVKPGTAQVFPINDNGGSLTVDDGSGSLTVDAPVGTPVYVRLSDGTSAIATLPVSGTLATTQGTPAAEANAWPTKISDGTNHAGITDVAGSKCVNVAVLQTVAQASNITQVAGATIGESNALYTYPAQPPATLWSVHKAFTASETGTVIRTPTSGKTSYVKRIIITPTAGATAGAITIFDSSDSASTRLYKGTPTVAAGVIVIEYGTPRKLAAVDNVLKYTTATNITGDMIVEGYEL